MMMHIPAGVVFMRLDLNYYRWKWIKEWELIEVEFTRRRRRFEVRKIEKEEDRLIVVVSPIEEDGLLIPKEVEP